MMTLLRGGDVVVSAGVCRASVARERLPGVADWRRLAWAASPAYTNAGATKVNANFFMLASRYTGMRGPDFWQMGCEAPLTEYGGFGPIARVPRVFL
jgi:hypothetical protein